MSTLCGTNCDECTIKDKCRGCEATCGSPFGGRCIAAQYIKIGGKEAYKSFKSALLAEINALLLSLGIPETDALHEMAGEFVNLAYALPSGKRVKFLDDKNIYLCSQISFADIGVCYGVVADESFILVCSYSVNGSMPELVAYKKR